MEDYNQLQSVGVYKHAATEHHRILAYNLSYYPLVGGIPIPVNQQHFLLLKNLKTRADAMM